MSETNLPNGFKEAFEQENADALHEQLPRLQDEKNEVRDQAIAELRSLKDSVEISRTLRPTLEEARDTLQQDLETLQGKDTNQNLDVIEDRVAALKVFNELIEREESSEAAPVESSTENTLDPLVVEEKIQALQSGGMIGTAISVVSSVMGPLEKFFPREAVEKMAWEFVRKFKILNFQPFEATAKAHLELIEKKSKVRKLCELVGKQLERTIVFDDKGAEALMRLSNDKLNPETIRTLASTTPEGTVTVTATALLQSESLAERQAAERRAIEEAKREERETKAMADLRTTLNLEESVTIGRGARLEAAYASGQLTSLTLPEIAVPQEDTPARTLLTHAKNFSHTDTLTVEPGLDDPVVEQDRSGTTVRLPQEVRADEVVALDLLSQKIGTKQRIQQVELNRTLPTDVPRMQFTPTTGRLVLNPQALASIASFDLPEQIDTTPGSVSLRLEGDTWTTETVEPAKEPDTATETDSNPSSPEQS